MPTAAQLKAFHALGKEGTFKLAAARLGLTQPAVSIQIRNLEEESSRTLIRRGGQKIALTEDGKHLLDLIEHRSRFDRDIARYLAPSGLSERQVIVLGADGPHVALDLIAACQQRNPYLEVEVKLANWEGTWINLLGLKVDAAVMANPPVDQRVHAELISTQSLQAWIPSGNPLGQQDEVTFDELCAYPLIFRENGSFTQRMVDEALTSSQLLPRIAMRIGSREGVREAVARGIGIGFGFSRENDHIKGFDWVPITGFADTDRDMLLCLSQHKDSTIIQSLRQAIKDVAMSSR